MSTAAASSYFTRLGENSFMPTHQTSGAWRVSEQHISPTFGLITHAVDQYIAARGDDDGLVISRLSFDILGVIKLEEMHIEVRTVRPGRTVELIEAVVTSGGRAVVSARVWRLAAHDTARVAGGEPETLPQPDSVAPWAMSGLWPGDYISSLDVRAVRQPEPGRGSCWLRSDVSLVEGEQISPLAHFVRLVDTTNGIAVRQPPSEWMFPNLDLTIHLYRQPVGDFTGLDTSVIFGSAGVGLTSTVLHDIYGAVGIAAQALTVREMAGPLGG